MDGVLDLINEELIEAFENVMKIEALYMDRECKIKLSMTEVHTIAAIGIAELKSMGEIARRLHITVGTLTVAITNLVKKGYVERYKSEEDRRIVKVGLTKKKKKIYDIHEKFHHELADALVKGFNVEEKQIVARALANLGEFIAIRYEV